MMAALWALTCLISGAHAAIISLNHDFEVDVGFGLPLTGSFGLTFDTATDTAYSRDDLTWNASSDAQVGWRYFGGTDTLEIGVLDEYGSCCTASSTNAFILLILAASTPSPSIVSYSYTTSDTAGIWLGTGMLSPSAALGEETVAPAILMVPSVTAIPVGGTIPLLGGGLVILGWVLRRRPQS
jgi:hypothetical protein